MLRILLPILLAIALIWLLVAYAGLDIGSVWARLTGFGLWWVAIAVATGLQLGISAEKWLRALDALNDDPDRHFSFGTGFFYTSLAAVASQVLTVYAASIVVRSLATRFHHRLGLARGAASSGFEQFFDVAVLAVIAVPTIALLTFGLGTAAWLALTALAAFVLWHFLAQTPLLIEHLRRAVPGQRIGRMLADPSVDKLSEPRLARQFFALSLARYAVMFGRVAIICFAAGFMVDLSDLLTAFNAGQISQLVALTPGNIGLFEWSWSGALAYRGLPIALALEMAILIRVATFFCFVALTILSALWLLAERARGRARSVL